MGLMLVLPEYTSIDILKSLKSSKIDLYVEHFEGKLSTIELGGEEQTCMTQDNQTSQLVNVIEH